MSQVVSSGRPSWRRRSSATCRASRTARRCAGTACRSRSPARWAPPDSGNIRSIKWWKAENWFNLFHYSIYQRLTIAAVFVCSVRAYCLLGRSMIPFPAISRDSYGILRDSKGFLKDLTGISFISWIFHKILKDSKGFLKDLTGISFISCIFHEILEDSQDIFWDS